MDPNEHRLLVKIDEEVRKQGESLAWIRGRLEEVHSRAAEIPVVIADQQELRSIVRLLWVAIIGGMIATAPSVWSTLLSFLPH